MKATAGLPRSVAILGLAAAACLGGSGTCNADGQRNVAPRPTAAEAHWHREFVRLFDAGHTHQAAFAADNLERALQGLDDAQGWYILGNDFNASTNGIVRSAPSGARWRCSRTTPPSSTISASRSRISAATTWR
nr:hypothetical protein [uncultured Lichenicoccus sp.]